MDKKVLFFGFLLILAYLSITPHGQIIWKTILGWNKQAPGTSVSGATGSATGTNQGVVSAGATPDNPPAGGSSPTGERDLASGQNSQADGLNISGSAAGLMHPVNIWNPATAHFDTVDPNNPWQRLLHGWGL